VANNGKVVLSTWVPIARRAAARRLARARGRTVSELLADALDALLADASAEPERVAQFTEAATARLRVARRVAAMAGGD
jgi:hypothetical protein